MSLVNETKPDPENEEEEGTELGEDSENEAEEDENEEDEEDEDEDEDDNDDDDDDVAVVVESSTAAEEGEGREEEDDDEDDDIRLNDLDASDDEDDYKKLENYSVIENLENEHPEIRSINFEEVFALSRVQRDSAGNIMDPLHISIPFLTKYEKARIIGARAEQLDRGAVPFVKVDDSVMNGRTIAIMEFDEKKIPFIIARPLPNKAVEYWRLQDLEFL